MPRPRKSTEREFYDIFWEWPLADQAAAIRVMEELHRQKGRMKRRAETPGPQPATEMTMAANDDTATSRSP